MEGCVQPHGTDDAGGDGDRALALLPLPPGRDHRQTYIVQVPKDQVFRVPPPQNAEIVERHRNSHVRNKPGRGCPRLLLIISLVVLAIVALIGITLAILYFIFTPTGPAFSVTNFVVKNSSPSSGSANKTSRPQYQISLTAKNPNKRLVVEYQRDAEVSLLYEKKWVATGKFPPLDQDPHDSTEVVVELTGSDGPLPPRMEKSMNDNKSNTPVAFDLEMKLRVKIRVAGLETWVMKSDVACEFKVSTQRNVTRVLSQECQTNFKQR